MKRILYCAIMFNAFCMHAMLFRSLRPYSTNIPTKNHITDISTQFLDTFSKLPIAQYVLFFAHSTHEKASKDLIKEARQIYKSQSKRYPLLTFHQELVAKQEESAEILRRLKEESPQDREKLEAMHNHEAALQKSIAAICASDPYALELCLQNLDDQNKLLTNFSRQLYEVSQEMKGIRKTIPENSK